MLSWYTGHPASNLTNPVTCPLLHLGNIGDHKISSKSLEKVYLRWQIMCMVSWLSYLGVGLLSSIIPASDFSITSLTFRSSHPVKKSTRCITAPILCGCCLLVPCGILSSVKSTNSTVLVNHRPLGVADCVVREGRDECRRLILAGMYVVLLLYWGCGTW